MKKITIYLTLLLSVLFISCQDDDSKSSNNNPEDDVFSQNFGNAITSDFMGRVVDMNNNPIAGASVEIGNVTLQTDQNGIFLAEDALVYEKFAYITVSKPGYIDGSRAIDPTTGKNVVTIMMIPSTPVATIASGAQSEVSLPSGTKVTFDGAFETESGAAYSGDVQVSMFHLMPSDANLNSLMPGSLYAKDSEGDEAYLVTYGMLNVELRGSNGQKLQIADGHTAEISVMIDNAQLASAPSTMPLWHFDEQRGYWIEEGSASKVGNRYVGEVSHFSWWNCDLNLPVVNLTVTLVDSAGNPVPFIPLTLTAVNVGESMNITDSYGVASGIVPANVPLSIQIPDNCGSNALSQPIGALTQDTNLTFTVPNSPQAQLVNISGTVQTCDGGPVTAGYALLSVEGDVYSFPVSGSEFTYSLFQCNPAGSYSIQIYNMPDSEASPAATLYYADQPINFGAITTCAPFQADLQGNWTLTVTNNNTGAIRVFEEETIVLNTTDNSYQTTSTALYLPGQLDPAPEQGFKFFVIGNTITVPEQDLANYWSNQLSGQGEVSDLNFFTIDYQITFAAGNTTYTGVYVRNF